MWVVEFYNQTGAWGNKAGGDVILRYYDNIAEIESRCPTL